MSYSRLIQYVFIVLGVVIAIAVSMTVVYLLVRTLAWALQAFAP